MVDFFAEISNCREYNGVNHCNLPGSPYDRRLMKSGFVAEDIHAHGYQRNIIKRSITETRQ
jgi:hypothetical protein